MLAAAAVGTSQPIVAALLGLGASCLAGAVVAMAWSVHTRQIRLAELLVRRQFILSREPGETEAGLGGYANGYASAEADRLQFQETLEAVGAREFQAGQLRESQAREAQAREALGRETQARDAQRDAQPREAQAGPKGNGTHPARGSARPGKLTIEGPETVVVGEQVSYRVRPSAVGTAVTWAVGGGSVSQAPDPARPDELVLIADRPGELMLHVRVREGLTERRETKSITALPEAAPAAAPFPLRLFLHGWGLVVVAVMVIGFAGALVALGDLTSADFIALVVPVTALLGVLAAVRGGSEADPPGPGSSGPAPPRSQA
jgi:hypothetical protein